MTPIGDAISAKDAYDAVKNKDWLGAGLAASAQFRQVIESAPDLYNNMKMLLKIHTKPSVLYKDFLTRPLVNKVNKNKNQEIV